MAGGADSCTNGASPRLDVQDRGISHEHILGTVTLVLFMGLWMLPLIPLLMLTIDWKIVAPYCGWVFLGLTVADSMHIAADRGRKQREHTEKLSA